MQDSAHTATTGQASHGATAKRNLSKLKGKFSRSATKLAFRPDKPSTSATLGLPPITTSNTTSDNKSSEPSPKASSRDDLVSRPIYELWDEAYEDLRAREESLVKSYEANLIGRAAAIVEPTTVIGSSKITRKDYMQVVLKLKMEEVEGNAWKLKFGGQQYPVKDLVEPVASVIESLNHFIEQAINSNGYASIAWAGISLFLPLFLNPSKQAKSLAKGLEYVSGLISQSSMREELYRRRYETCSNDQSMKTFATSHEAYKKALKNVYTQILKFEATTVCHLSKNSASRISLEMIKWEDWDSLLEDVKAHETVFKDINDIWKDTKYQEECDAYDKRHQESLKSLELVGSSVAGLQKAVEEMQQDRSRSELLHWLSTVDPSENYNSARNRHAAGTGDWLVRDDETFWNWEEFPNSFLWLHGKAGSGKSILSSSVIRHLKDLHDCDPQTALGYFYFSFSDEKKQNTVGMLRSMIKQICSRRPDIPQSVKDLGQYKEKGQYPDKESLENALASTVSGFSRVYLIIDALDEVPYENHEREQLLACIVQILRLPEARNLRLLCTSRREADIDTVLRPLLSSSTNAEIDLSTYTNIMDHDVSLYIDTTLAGADYQSWPDDIKREAKELLLRKADGMFQYVSCQFDDLRRQKGRNQILRALNNLPKGLDATYDRMLQRIDTDLHRQVASVLKWLAFSFRPLSVSELAEVFILDKAPVPFNEDNRLFKPTDVLGYLSGMAITFSQGDETADDSTESKEEGVLLIRRAHYSVQEYLTSDRMPCHLAKEFSFTEADAHLHILESCLTYCLQVYKIQIKTESEHFELDRFRVFNYAAYNWADHLERVQKDLWPGSVIYRVRELLVPSASAYLNVGGSKEVNRRTRDAVGPIIGHFKAPLIFAAYRGHCQLANILISNGVDVNDSFENERHTPTALYAASFRGRKHMVQLLLDEGADVNAQGGDYGNALQAAVCSGSTDTIQLLLDKGADVNAQGGDFGNALQAAAFDGHADIVQLLLDGGADVNAQRGTYENALQAAAYRGHTDTVQLLLDKGADVNTQRGKYGNALQAAACNGKKDTIQFLLDKGADINAQGGHFGNALQAAIAQKCLDVARLLFQRGARVDPPGPQWEELLIRLREDHWPDAVQRLCEFQENPIKYSGLDTNPDTTTNSSIQPVQQEDEQSTISIEL